MSGLALGIVYRAGLRPCSARVFGVLGGCIVHGAAGDTNRLAHGVLTDVQLLLGLRLHHVVSGFVVLGGPGLAVEALIKMVA